MNNTSNNLLTSGGNNETTAGRIFHSPIKERKRLRKSHEEEEEEEVTMTSMAKQLTWITRTLQQVESNTADIPRIANSVRVLEEANETNQKKIAKLEETVDYLMKGGLNNLILHGLPEETDEDTKSTVEKFLFDTLGGIRAELEYARRIGRATSSAKRIILMKLKSVEQRNEILANRNKLFDINKATGSAYYINEDLPKSEREEQAKIRQVFKDIKAKDATAKLKGKRILSQGRICQLNEEGQQVWTNAS